MLETSKDDVEIMPADWANLVPSIFSRCVDPVADRRYDLTRPFVVGDHLYATNGRIAVRMPTPPAWTIPNAEKIVRCIPDVFDFESRPDPVPIPEVVGVCEACKGAKVLPERECKACDGEGEEDVSDCDCPRCLGSHDCQACDGKGRWPAGPCRDCDGSGVSDATGYLKLAPGYWIGRGYGALLREFDVVAFLPRKIDGKDSEKLRFRFLDVEGVLCPMRPPGPDEEASSANA